MKDENEPVKPASLPIFPAGKLSAIMEEIDLLKKQAQEVLEENLES
jgi:hypothetical protein